MSEQEQQESLPSLPVALVKGFLLRPLLCVVLCLACLGGRWWCNGRSDYHQRVATGFIVPGQSHEEQQRMRGFEPDPLDAIQTEQGQYCLMVASLYRHASTFLGYAAFGWMALGAIGGVAKWRKRE